MSFWNVLFAVVAGLFTVLLSVTLLLALAVVALWWLRRRTRRRLPRRMILEVDLRTAVVETEAGDPLARILNRDALTLRQIVEALERARGDARIAAVVVDCSGASMGLAQAQEIRAALRALVDAGKEVVAHADSFGEGAPGWVGYYVASAANRVVLQPSGDVNLTGFLAEQPFLRRVLERIGVTPRFQQRHEYKSIVELFDRESMSDEAKEALGWILDDLLEVLCTGIAEGRALDVADVADAVSSGPHAAEAAKERGLVDAIGYRDEVYSALREAHGEKAQLRYLGHYHRRSKSLYDKGPVIAVVVGDGDIMRGESSFNPRTQSASMGAQTIASALRAAARDDDVKAILFRVSSRGGSYVASDTIWREVVRAKEAGKPVVVWMGDYAASGGYFVAAPANAIVAQDLTLTGSIGVAGGKFVLDGLWDKLGIRFDGVRTHDNATYFSANHDYDEAGAETATLGFDRAYADFTAKVKEGRGLDDATVDAVARGRVWSGRQAKARGLVDEVGGFEVALDRVKREAGIEGRVRLQDFPRPKELWEQALSTSAKNSDEAGRSVALSSGLAGLWWWLSLPLLLRDLRRAEVRLEVPEIFASRRGFWRP